MTLKRTGHEHMVNVLHAEGLEFGDAGLAQGVGDVFVETRLHDADVQVLSVGWARLAFVGVFHADSFGM